MLGQVPGGITRDLIVGLPGDTPNKVPRFVVSGSLVAIGALLIFFGDRVTDPELTRKFKAKFPTDVARRIATVPTLQTAAVSSGLILTGILGLVGSLGEG